jgi:hypothetical protein
MRPLLFLLLLSAAGLSAAPALPLPLPPAWRLAHPDAQILAGVDFTRLAASKQGAALAARFSAALGADLVARAQSMLLSSSFDAGGRRSDLLVLTGAFELAGLRKLAAAEGAKVASYKGVEIAAPPGASMSDPHLAWIDGATLLIGTRPAIVAAADRLRAQVPDLGAVNALFTRGADLSASFPVWVACDTLPQGLGPASLDALLDAEGGIEGLDLSFSLEESAALNFWLWTGSPDSAQSALASFQSAATDASATFLLRPFLASLRGSIEGTTLNLGAALPADSASAHIAPLLSSLGLPLASASPAQPPAPKPVRTEPPSPPRPLFVRIQGLESGAVQIPFEKR